MLYGCETGMHVTLSAIEEPASGGKTNSMPKDQLVVKIDLEVPFQTNCQSNNRSIFFLFRYVV